MSGATSIYGLPFLEPDDPPDIAGISQDISEAVEAELERIDQELGTTVGMEATSEVSPQAIAASTIVAVRWQTASSNVGGFGKPSAFEFTVPSAGVYVATVQGLVANSQSARAFAQVLMDGRQFRTPFGGSGESGFGAAGMRRLAAGTVIKAEIFCATATSMNGATLAVYKLGS